MFPVIMPKLTDRLRCLLSVEVEVEVEVSNGGDGAQRTGGQED